MSDRPITGQELGDIIEPSTVAILKKYSNQGPPSMFEVQSDLFKALANCTNTMHMLDIDNIEHDFELDKALSAVITNAILAKLQWRRLNKITRNSQTNANIPKAVSKI